MTTAGLLHLILEVLLTFVIQTLAWLPLFAFYLSRKVVTLFISCIILQGNRNESSKIDERLAQIDADDLFEVGRTY